MKHTKEPWGASREDIESYTYDNEGNCIFVVYVYRGEEERIPVFGDNAREDARRIVACVNAMAGIEDPVAFVEWAKRQPGSKTANTRPPCYRCKGTGSVTYTDLDDHSKHVFPCEECSTKVNTPAEERER